ncbi:MAG: HAD family hydrolase [Dorea sp.]|nr:HAD family hydrolase [Dorea sp.]
MIKAVFFDIDNTVCNYDRAHAAAMEELFRFGEDEFSFGREEMDRLLSEAQDRVTGRLGKGSAAIHNRLIRFQDFLERMPETDLTKALRMNEIYWDTFLETIAPEPGLAEFLSALQEAGILIGIGSDQNADVQYRKLEALGILPYFSRIVTSEEAGAEKPAEEFFRLCVEKSGCKAAECVFIGDNIKKDVKGALKNGLRGVWYHPRDTEPKNKEYGFPVISSYTGCLRNIENIFNL